MVEHNAESDRSDSCAIYVQIWSFLSCPKESSGKSRDVWGMICFQKTRNFLRVDLP